MPASRLALALLPLLSPGAGTVDVLEHEARLVADDATAGDQIGFSVALDGDTLALGAPMYLPLLATGAGKAVVLRGVGPGWEREAVLEPPDGRLGDHFGWAVDVDGDTLAVTAAYADDLGGTSGKAYVFVREASEWRLQATLLPSDGSAGRLFGESVSLDGDRLLVGSSGGSGRAYVFERTGEVWTEVERIAPPDLGSVDHFGFDVALDGDTAWIGAPTASYGGRPLSGNVRAFERIGADWVQTASFGAPSYSLLGRSVDLDGDTAVAVAPPQGPSQVRVYGRMGGQWIEEDSFAEVTGATLRSVALDGSRIVVSRLGAGNQVGAYVFERDANGWVETLHLVDGLEGIGHGDDVALEGDVAISGAPGYDVGPEENAGLVLGFHLSGRSAERFCSASANSSGRAAYLGVTGGLSVAADDAWLFAFGAPAATQGIFLYGPNEGHLHFGDGILCISPFYPGVLRLVPVSPTDASGIASRRLELATLPPQGTIRAGETWVFQFLFRDPAAGGTGFDLSDGLRLSFTP